MNIDPDQIRAEIDALLAQLPDPGDQQNLENGPRELELAELEEIARRLSDAPVLTPSWSGVALPGLVSRPRS